MEWQQLIYFQCVAKTCHIGEASEILHVTQPAISMSIKKLENELGVSLFDRRKKNIWLNKYGRVFLKHVETVMSEIETAKQEIQHLYTTDENRVKVMIPSNILTSSFMETLYAKKPNIMIENLNIDYQQAKDGLVNGTLDVCILSPPIEGPGIEVIPLEKQKMCILTSDRHPLASRDSIYLSELKNESFVAYSEETAPRMHFEKHCHSAGFSPIITYECNSIRNMFAPVSSGHSISFVSLEALNSYNLKGLHVIHLKDPDVYTVLGLSITEKNREDPLVMEVVNAVLERYPDRGQIKLR